MANHVNSDGRRQRVLSSLSIKRRLRGEEFLSKPNGDTILALPFGRSQRNLILIDELLDGQHEGPSFSAVFGGCQTQESVVE
jgi:hypothetical protein